MSYLFSSSSSIRRFLWKFRLQLGILLSSVAIALWLSTPAQAVQAQVTPTNPQLGDTLSVIVQGNTMQGNTVQGNTMQNDAATLPTVTFQQKTYPTFAIGNNRYRALLATTPLDRPGRLTIQVKVGDAVQNLAVQLRDRSFPTQRITVSGGGSDGTDTEFDRVDAFKAIVSPQKFWSGAFVRPNAGEITTVYGVRRYYNGVFAQDYYHRGVDYAAPTGDPIVAPAAGRITLVGREAEGFRLHGNTIGIDHGQGVTSIFIHLSRIDVKEGDFVQAGQRIGALGATGSATGPNLHWGLNVHGESVDPVPWRYAGFE